MFGEYPRWEQLNELAEDLEDVDEKDVLLALMSDYAVDFSQAIEQYKSGDWILYEHCDDMGDVAKRICCDDPAFTEASDFMQRHFDFDSYGEELDSCGTFIPCGNGYLEVF